jgi:hypothetical protein
MPRAVQGNREDGDAVHAILAVDGALEIDGNGGATACGRHQGSQMMGDQARIRPQRRTGIRILQNIRMWQSQRQQPAAIPCPS